MKWPFVSRKRHAIVLENAIMWAGKWAEKAAEVQQLQSQLVAEKLRRAKAEAEVRYRNERIQRVLGLPIWPADEEKKTA